MLPRVDSIDLEADFETAMRRIVGVRGFGPAELGRIVRLVRTNRDMLLGRWNEFFEN
jgi:hypothetical protein